MQNPTIQEFFDNYVVLAYGRGLVRSAIAHASHKSQYKVIERALIELFYPEQRKVYRTWQITADKINKSSGDNVFEFDTTWPIIEPRSLTLWRGELAKKDWTEGKCCCQDSESSFEECEICSCDPCNYELTKPVGVTYVQPGQPLGKNQYTIIGGASTRGTGGTKVRMKVCETECCDFSDTDYYITYLRGPAPLYCATQRMFVHWEYLHVIADFVAVRLGIRAQNFRAGDEGTYKALGIGLMDSLDLIYGLQTSTSVFENQSNPDLKLSDGNVSGAIEQFLTSSQY